MASKPVVKPRRMTKPSIEDTINFIKIAHASQFDKGGVEYWKHPVSVMHRLGPDASEDYKLVALLHDVIEDTEYNAASLLKLGYSANVVASVERLTKPKDLDYLECIRALAATRNRWQSQSRSLTTVTIWIRGACRGFLRISEAAKKSIAAQ
jgi:(p)ppGpp synthase/HD superfamily hydrolase